MNPAERTQELATRGDLDGLLEHLDRLIDDRDWDEVLRLRRLARAAIERGHQVWPAATHAEYRLALEAPGRWCAEVLVPDAGRFAPGPLAEVAASTHTWAEVAPSLAPTPVRAQFAAERVIRGEDLHDTASLGEPAPEIPLRLAPWEPSYPLATYRPDGVEADAPSPPPPDRWHAVDLTAQISDPQRSVLDDPQATDALRSTVAHWVDRSNGRCEVLAVTGTHREALAALGAPNPRVCPLEPAEAMAQVVWAGGSGGSQGRRRGMAIARFDLWWLLVALAGLIDEWPLNPVEVGEIAHDLDWYAWDTNEAITGWSLRLAIEDRTDDLAWIISATDG